MQENQELPQGWVLVPLGSVNTSINTTKPELRPDTEFIYLDIASIDNKSQRVVSPQKLKGSNAPSRARQVVKTNDILFSTVRTYLKNIAQVEQQYDGQIASTGFCVIRPSDATEPNYIFNFVQSQGFLQPLSEIQRGTSYPAVRDSDVFAQTIPLPPLPEQRRIVAKLEELFSRLDAGVATLRQTQAQLKRYRQSVLHAAVTGELTRAWRAAGPAQPQESGATLLQRIRQERRAQWEAAQVAKRGSQLPLNDAWKSKYEEPAAPDTSELPELPEGWVWARMSQISEATGGFAFSSQDFAEAGEYQVIKIANVKPGRLVLDSRPAFINGASLKEDTVAKYLLKKDDCVITLTGTREKRDYGFVCRVKKEANLLLNQRLAYVRFYAPLLAPYFEYAMVSKHFQDNFFKYETGNVGQGNVGMRAITDETIMLPPLAEQAEIVAEVERRLSVLDNLERTLTAELTRAERLRQSILHRAFTGQLVPQDPTDEPAATLLARLQAAPASAPAAKAKRGRQPKATQTTLAL